MGGAVSTTKSGCSICASIYDTLQPLTNLSTDPTYSLVKEILSTAEQTKGILEGGGNWEETIKQIVGSLDTNGTADGANVGTAESVGEDGRRVFPLNEVLDNLIRRMLGEEGGKGRGDEEEATEKVEGIKEEEKINEFLDLTHLITRVPKWSTTKAAGGGKCPIQVVCEGNEHDLAIFMMKNLPVELMEATYMELYETLQQRQSLLKVFNNVLPTENAPHTFAKAGRLDLLKEYKESVKEYDWSNLGR